MNKFFKAILLFSTVLGIFASEHLLGNDQFPSHIGTYETVTAPSGRFIALAGIALGETSPSFRLRLRILVVNVSAGTIDQILTGVEQKWVVAWSGEDVLLVAGLRDFDSAYSVTAYEWRAGQMVRREATDREKAMADDAFGRKYDQLQKPKT